LERHRRLTYWEPSNGSWLQQGDTTSTDESMLSVQPGEALNVIRRNAATGPSTFLSQPVPFADPRQ